MRGNDRGDELHRFGGIDPTGSDELGAGGARYLQRPTRLLLHDRAEQRLRRDEPRGERSETTGRRCRRRRGCGTRDVVGHRDRRPDLRRGRPRLRVAFGDGGVAHRRTPEEFLPRRREQQRASHGYRPTGQVVAAPEDRSRRRRPRGLLDQPHARHRQGPFGSPRHARSGIRRCRASGLLGRRREDRAVDQRRGDAARQSARCAASRRADTRCGQEPGDRRQRHHVLSERLQRPRRVRCHLRARRVEDERRSRNPEALRRDLRGPGSIRRNRVRRDGDGGDGRARHVSRRSSFPGGSRRRPPGIRIASTLLGSSVSFDRHHELIGGRYWMYRIEGGSYTQVP